MNLNIRKAYIAAYSTDKEFAKIVKYLRECKRVSEDRDIIFSKTGYPFLICDGLIYNY